jgi:hypothetical protein
MARGRVRPTNVRLLSAARSPKMICLIFCDATAVSGTAYLRRSRKEAPPRIIPDGAYIAPIRGRLRAECLNASSFNE